MSTMHGAPTSAEPDEAVATVAAAPAAANPLLSLNPRRWLSASASRAYPIIIALVIIWIGFDIANHNYFKAQNVSNILLYMTEIGVLGIGVVVILLLGEIDLSIASTAALSGTSAALVMQNWFPHASPGPQALAGIATALIIGIACGAFQGLWVAYLRIPSFVVTLAGLLAFQGIALAITNAQTVPIGNDYFNSLGAAGTGSVLDGGYLPAAVGIVVAIATGLGYGLVLYQNYRDRQANGLSTQPPVFLAAQAAVVLVIALGVVLVLNHDRGVPLPVFIMFVLLILFAYVLRRTRYGRHIYATGGSTEAARRAGIDVQRLRWSAFVISGLMAGIASVIFMANLNSAAAGSIGQDALLNAIAAAVIGGTSLFGGRGTIWAALLGAMVLSSVQTGMDLTLAGNTNTNYYEFIVKGAILLVAVWLDTYAKSKSPIGRATG